MRKILIGIFMFICVLLVGCGGGGKPDDVSDEMYQKALYVVKVCDLYLDGLATQEETIEKIKAIDPPEIDITTASRNETAIWSGIMNLHADCTKMKFGKFEMSSFRENRDKIAEAINYKD